MPVDGTKTRGRPHGSINKRRRDLHDLATKLNIDPFEILLLFAKGDWQTLGYNEEFDKKFTDSGITYERVISPELRKSSARDACKYLYPELRSVEHSGPDGEPMSFEFSADQIKLMAKATLDE